MSCTPIFFLSAERYIYIFNALHSLNIYIFTCSRENKTLAAIYNLQGIVGTILTTDKIHLVKESNNSNFLFAQALLLELAVLHGPLHQ